MKIKPLFKERQVVDVSEWNDEIKAYFRPLDGFESLVFNDYFLEFHDKNRGNEERFDSAFKAGLMALVDENGAPLLTEEDRDAVKAASFVPFYRMFNAGLSGVKKDEPIETAKKN